MNRKSTILIIEDELHIADLIKLNLKIEGYNSLITGSGKEGLEIIKTRSIDLVILDVLLPDSNGIDLCRKIKTSFHSLPVLMISALGQSHDRIKGLKSGADDYLGKPFNLEELLLKVQNLLKLYHRTTNEADLNSLIIGNAEINLTSMTIVSLDKETVYDMTLKEVELLKYMLENKNIVLSRQTILEHVWGYDQYPNTRTIDNFILNFRKRIELDPNNPKIIKTVRGVGYMIKL